MCHMGCVKFARYCGQMYRRHLFSYGGLSRFIPISADFDIKLICIKQYVVHVIVLRSFPQNKVKHRIFVKLSQVVINHVVF